MLFQFILLRALRPVYTGEFCRVTQCKFVMLWVASSCKHVQNFGAITETNCKWFTRMILKLQFRAPQKLHGVPWQKWAVSMGLYSYGSNSAINHNNPLKSTILSFPVIHNLCFFFPSEIYFFFSLEQVMAIDLTPGSQRTRRYITKVLPCVGLVVLVSILWINWCLC